MSMPRLTYCVVCSDDDVVALDPGERGLVCQKHRTLPNCGTHRYPVKRDQCWCVKCGRIVCRQCHREPPPGSTFCNRCGRRVLEERYPRSPWWWPIFCVVGVAAIVGVLCLISGLIVFLGIGSVELLAATARKLGIPAPPWGVDSPPVPVEWKIGWTAVTYLSLAAAVGCLLLTGQALRDWWIQRFQQTGEEADCSTGNPVI